MLSVSALIEPQLYLSLPSLPVDNEVNLDIATKNDEERYEEYLTVEDGVVNVCPLDRSEAKEEHVSSIAHRHRAGEVMEEVVGSALVELLSGVLQHPEDDGLGTGEQYGQQPGDEHHQPGQRYKKSIKIRAKLGRFPALIQTDSTAVLHWTVMIQRDSTDVLHCTVLIQTDSTAVLHWTVLI